MTHRKRAEGKARKKKGSKYAPKNDTVPETQAAKRKKGRGKDDDTPKAFKRLMAFTSGKMKTRSGLDDGIDRRPKGAKPGEEPKPEVEPKPEEETAVPTILPGETLSDFAARVDAAIPVAGLINKTGKGGKDPVGLKAFRTRKEKKMHKLYATWREEEVKIQDQKEEELELIAERELESGNQWSGAGAGAPRDWDPVTKGNGKKRKRGGKGKNKEEDPWEELRRLRGEKKVKFGDVAQAPPSLQAMSAKLSAKLPTRE
ncbi:hypothetical protein IMZ48_29140 [Candidatus Bathyarchaeota archaeon]|nr:hypothetical protein [Candidatus Bathyarchaeota archaeon]